MDYAGLILSILGKKFASIIGGITRHNNDIRIWITCKKFEYVALCVYCVAMAEKSDCLAEQVSGSSSTASKALSRSLL